MFFVAERVWSDSTFAENPKLFERHVLKVIHFARTMESINYRHHSVIIVVIIILFLTISIAWCQPLQPRHAHKFLTTAAMKAHIQQVIAPSSSYRPN